MATINDVWTAYEEARASWSGCNWPTHYGGLGLDLKDLSSADAHRAANRWRAIAANAEAGEEVTAEEEAVLVDMALHLRLRRAVVSMGGISPGLLRVCKRSTRGLCAESLAREWDLAAEWLADIELDARWAEHEGQEAVSAAEDGDWDQALAHARKACSIESAFGAPRGPWEHLEGAIEHAASIAWLARLTGLKRKRPAGAQRLPRRPAFSPSQQAIATAKKMSL